MHINTLLRLCAALGCAPVQLEPMLGLQPRKGLLWDRGVFVKKR